MLKSVMIMAQQNNSNSNSNSNSNRQWLPGKPSKWLPVMFSRPRNWWVAIEFNLWAFMVYSLAIVALVAVGGALYLAAKAIALVAGFIWSIRLWILGAGILAAVIWLLTKVKWSQIKLPSARVGWSFIGLIAVLLIGLLAFRGCDDRTETPTPVVEHPNQPQMVTVERFQESFDWVVTTRAYLDGVQGEGELRALVGLKFVDGKSVKDMSFNGKTYEEAKAIIAKDWSGLVVEQLKGIDLTEQQIVVVTLFAMRNGKYGFLKSDFLKEVKAGNLEGASVKMTLHQANGKARALGPEAKQYLWVLKNLWDGALRVEELIDMPMFSYKRIYSDLMYETDGTHTMSYGMYTDLKQGDYPTPRQALKLEEL